MSTKLKFKFRCCANKAHSYYCCVTCSHLFHPSCLDRDFTNHIKLGDHKIYCSKGCKRPPEKDDTLDPPFDELDRLQRENHLLRIQVTEKNNQLDLITSDKDEVIQGLEEQITEMKSEIKCLQSAIKRDRRKTQEFEDDVFQAEKEILGKLNMKSVEVGSLRDNIKSLKEERLALDLTLQSHKDKMSVLHRDIEDLTEINRAMITSIRALEAENSSYTNEIDVLKSQIASFSSGGGTQDLKRTAATTIQPMHSDHIQGQKQNVVQNQKKVKTTVDIPKKNKILILTDNFGKYMYNSLNFLLKNMFSIQVLCKPFAKLSEVISGSDSTIEGLNKSDFVIVLAGINNENISTKSLSSLANKCFYTNLIVCTIPINFNSTTSKTVRAVNSKIFNCMLKLCYYSSNVKMLDLQDKFKTNSFFSNNIFLNSRGKRLLAGFIYKAISEFSQNEGHKTLRFIDTGIAVDAVTSPESVLMAEFRACSSNNSVSDESSFLDKH